MECGSTIDLAGLVSDKIDAQIAASAGRLSADELSKMIRRIRAIPAQHVCKRKFCKLHHVEATTSANVASSIPQQFQMAMAIPLSTDTAALPAAPSTLLQSSSTPIRTHCVPLPGIIFTPIYPPPMGGMGGMRSMSGGAGGTMGGNPGPTGGVPSQMSMGIPAAVAVPFALGGMAFAALGGTAFAFAAPAGGATTEPAGSASRVASSAGATS